jgi:hypothetical protein
MAQEVAKQCIPGHVNKAEGHWHLADTLLLPHSSMNALLEFKRLFGKFSRADHM